MKSNFFILSAPRSGSTVLTRTLDQHPEIFCAGELFHPTDKIYHPEWHFHFWGKKKKKGFSRKIFSAANYVNGYIFAAGYIKKFYVARKGNKPVRGFKLMIGHIKDFPTVWKYLRQHNLKVIVLVRKNTFREALSSFRARKTGLFHAQKGATTVEEKVYVNAASLKRRVDQLEAIKQSILNISEGMNRIVINYEEFAAWQSMLNKIFAFLDVKEINMEPALNRTSGDDWRSGVENVEEIEDVLRDTYAHYLD